MSAFAVLVVALVAGALLVRFGGLPASAHDALDTYVIYLALPAVALSELHPVPITGTIFEYAAVPWAIFALAAGGFYLLKRWRGWSWRVYGALLVVTGVGNTSFVGLPMIQAFFGARYKPTGIVIDQLGTYLILSTVGITVAALCGGATRPRAREIATRVATFPPFLAVCVAFALHPIRFPAGVQSVLTTIGATLPPVALFSVGMQLRATVHEAVRGPLAAGLVARLVVFPAVALAGVAATLGTHHGADLVTVFEMGMPPTIGGAIIASRYELDEPLPSLLVGLGIIASFATLPAWSLLLHHL